MCEHVCQGVCCCRGVFEDTDGEISKLEAEAEAEPSKKINLLKYLQVHFAVTCVEQFDQTRVAG
jgi:hypothetical protein